MGVANEIIDSISAFQSLASAVIAQTCEDYFTDARALVRGNYRPNDDKSDTDKRLYKKTVEAKVESYREWFTDPNSDFNTFYKAIMTNGHGNSIMDGRAFIKRLDAMVEDTETYPEDHHSFRY